jgi:transcriptional regulator with XRE-family HTH domain
MQGMSEEAGRRFREVVEVALAKSHTVHSMADLLRCTGLHANTLYDLFRGATKDGPGPRTVNLIAGCLDIPTRWLWDAWQGREPEPDSTEEALRRHADALDAQTRLLGTLVAFIRSAAAAVADPLADLGEEADAQDRAGEADQSLPDPPADEGSAERPAPHGTKG